MAACGNLCYIHAMKTVGLIVEYNPLHHGHVHHFHQAKAVTGAEAAIAVMSGHFLQRGEPALVGKWARTEMALAMGADLVLELPVRYSAAPAEWFAHGAVCLLDRTRVVDTLCFGSEIGRLEPLRQLAARLAKEPAAFRKQLQRALKSGISYPAAFAAAATTMAGGDIAGLSGPNNSLGLHYLIALERLGSAITPYTIPRIKAEYHQTDATDSRIASATAIRRIILQEGGPAHAAGWLPPATLDVLEREFTAGRGPVTWEALSRLLLYRISTLSAEGLARFGEVDEGLEHRILSVLSGMRRETFRVDQFLDALKTKRYTRTKLQRMLVRILLEQPKAAFSRKLMGQGPAYIRVLGFNDRGRALLRRIRRESPLPVISRVGKTEAALLEEDIRATSVYALAFRDADPWQIRRDYYQTPIQHGGN